MNWESMIEVRRQKERAHLNPFKFVPQELTYKFSHFQTLTSLESLAVDFRFFCKLPIARIAERMGMSWNGADDLIDQAVRKILKNIPTIPD